MQKLQLANLYKAELIPVSGKLAERYNRCLQLMGIAPTSLGAFSIDGVGWSPEIAEEKQDSHYLNLGDANQHAIVITPLQKNKPIYIPYHSFDKDIMRFVFETYGAKINDITRNCAICIDFDQKIDVFYEPLDVLKYEYIHLRFHLIDNLFEAQQQQQQLIKTFHKGNNFIDEKIHARILDSATKHGDLRGRDLELPELVYKSASFFTRAFGGVYVLRDFIIPILVFKDKKAHNQAIKDTTHNVLIYHIEHRELLVKLKEHLIVEYDLKLVVETPRYDRIKKMQLALLLDKTEHSKKEILNNPVLFRNYLNKLDKTYHGKVTGVEQYLDKLAVSNTFKMHDIIDYDLLVAMYEPHSSLSATQQDLIWQLMVHIAPKDVLYLYWYDKESFYELYKKWDESLQEWVIETITKEIFNA